LLASQAAEDRRLLSVENQTRWNDRELEVLVTEPSAKQETIEAAFEAYLSDRWLTDET
jgi:hypothetical protein